MWASFLLATGAVLALGLFYGLVRRVRRIRLWSVGGVRCPVCGAHTAWKSRPRFPDFIYAVFSCVAYRCGGCGVRFYFYSGSAEAEG